MAHLQGLSGLKPIMNNVKCNLHKQEAVGTPSRGNPADRGPTGGEDGGHVPLQFITIIHAYGAVKV